METNLWLMPLESNNNNNNDNNTNPTKQPFVIQLKHTANSSYRQKLAAHLQAWHHAILEAPVVTTLIRVINKYWLTSFPGLIATGVRKHLPNNNLTSTQSEKESPTNRQGNNRRNNRGCRRRPIRGLHTTKKDKES